jgi:hypothetical protein
MALPQLVLLADTPDLLQNEQQLVGPANISEIHSTFPQCLGGSYRDQFGFAVASRCRGGVRDF